MFTNEGFERGRRGSIRRPRADRAGGIGSSAEAAARSADRLERQSPDVRTARFRGDP